MSRKYPRNTHPRTLTVMDTSERLPETHITRM